ncbi:MAG: DUF1819 family protein [Halanaerobiales bacterium]
MDKQLKYSTGIKIKPFLYIELKKMAKLKADNPEMTDSKLKTKTVEDNIFQYKNPNRRKEVASTILKRLKVLDNYLLNLLINGSMDISKYIAVYSILKTDRLFYEFMDEVYKDKYQARDPYLTDKDFNIYFQHKAEQSDRVAGWTDYTYYNLKRVFIKILVQAGLINNEKERKITKALINKEVIDHLINNDDPKYIQAMLGGI